MQHKRYSIASAYIVPTDMAYRVYGTESWNGVESVTEAATTRTNTPFPNFAALSI